MVVHSFSPSSCNEPRRQIWSLAKKKKCVSSKTRSQKVGIYFSMLSPIKEDKEGDLALENATEKAL